MPYRDRKAIDRMFGKIKDFRRVATRYDHLERNFLAAVCLAATVCYWSCVRSLSKRGKLIPVARKNAFGKPQGIPAMRLGQILGDDDMDHCGDWTRHADLERIDRILAGKYSMPYCATVPNLFSRVPSASTTSASVINRIAAFEP